MKKRFQYYTFLVLITPICFELALRILGYTAYQQVPFTIESTPNMCLTPSDSLGFSLGEGRFTVCVNGAPSYFATHIDSRRITRSDSISASQKKIFVMGCSYTYGMGVNDSESFPFQLQTHFKDYSVQNFGVPGYGTVQSLLQLKQKIREGIIPAMVIVNFCDFHHERNSLTPRFRNSLVIGYQRSNTAASKQLSRSGFPFMEDRQLKIVPYSKLYSTWAGRETFASINYLQTLRDERKRDKINQEENSKAVFLQIDALCRNHGIELIVTGLTHSTATKDFLGILRRAGIRVYDISLDLRLKKYNQLPYDTHPNANAHDHFTKKLIPIIENVISSRFPAN